MTNPINAHDITTGVNGKSNIIDISCEDDDNGFITITVTATLKNQEDSTDIGVIKTQMFATFDALNIEKWMISNVDLPKTKHLIANMDQCDVSLTTAGDHLYVTVTGPAIAMDVDWDVHTIIKYQSGPPT